jgi:hypothetical protein
LLRYEISLKGAASVGIDRLGPSLLGQRSVWSFLHMVCMFALSALLALLMLIATGCASIATTETMALPASSKLSELSDQLAWEPWILHPAKRKTKYSRHLEGGSTVVVANATSSASGLMHRLDATVSASTTLSWRWKVEDLIATADLNDRHSSDSPVRIVLAFDGDKRRLSGKEQAFFERVKLFSGQEMPYATLMYVWENRRPLEDVITNGHTSRVKKIVTSSGVNSLKKWSSFQRKVSKDFERAFGEKPGKLMGIALLTDTDNTGETATGYYADIKLLP